MINRIFCNILPFIGLQLGYNICAFAINLDEKHNCVAIDSQIPRYATLTSVQHDFLNPEKQEYLVAWDADREKEADFSEGYAEKPQSGSRFEVARCLSDGNWAFVGHGVAGGKSGRQVNSWVHALPEGKVQSLIEAKTVAGERALAQSGNLYWHPMVGDVVMPVRTQILNTLRVTPRLQFSFRELFEMRSNGSYSFNLSESGRQKLRENFGVFKSLNGRLLIEGAVNSRGVRSDLRLQSQMRAKAVAQFLVHDFNLEADKLVVLGNGSDGLPTGYVQIPKWPGLDMSDSITLRSLP